MAFKGSVIGDVYEKIGYMEVEWKIRDFFSLKDEEDSYYDSPVFVFAQSCLCLRLYPNNKKIENDKWIGVYVIRKDSGPPRLIEYDIGILEKGGSKNILCEGKVEFVNKARYGTKEFYLRSKLLEQKSQLAPFGNLTITCGLERDDINHSTKDSVFTRLWKYCCDFKKILSAEKKTDFTFELSDCKLSAHKVILENRCDYFEKMFNNDWLENKRGEGNLSQYEGDVFKNVLSYLYSGDVEELTEENIGKIYTAAHELLLEELKILCVDTMKEILNVEIICNVILIAEKYDEKELKEYALNFFAQNAEKIFATEQWKELKKNNQVFSSELLENLWNK